MISDDFRAMPGQDGNASAIPWVRALLSKQHKQPTGMALQYLSLENTRNESFRRGSTSPRYEMFYLLALNYRMFLMVSGQVAPQEHMAGQLEHPSREHLTRCWAHAGGADGTCSILLKDQGNEGMNIRFPTVLLFAMVPLL